MARRIALALAVVCTLWVIPAAAEEATDLAVLRNTVINMLDAMVKRGLMSREAADELVKDAQTKADAEVAARQAENAPAPGDVRVTYVPQIVKDELSEQVAKDVQEKVAADVVATAKSEGWGVPGALPDWVRRARWTGDARVRATPIFLDNDNAEFAYVDFQTVNDKGGIGKAGADAYFNTTHDDVRYQLRARFGFETEVSDIATVGIKLATGETDVPVSRNESLSNDNNGLGVLVDEAYLRLGGPLAGDRQKVVFWAGRFPNPWQGTELVWDTDLRFNGLAVQYAWNAAPGAPRGIFGTAGLFPLERVELSSNDKWLAGAQLGYEFGWGEGARASVAGAWYDYRNITGQRNSPDSTLLDYTAPGWVQKGNTLFDIRNDTDNDTNLFALAAEYQLLDINAALTFMLRPDLRLEFLADYVTNIGYDEQEVFARTGVVVAKRADGYRAEMRLGNPQINALWDWRVFAAYNYLERDAVLDGFTDTDFHGGGTDAEGYIFGGDLGITRNTWLRLRYLSATEIDGPPLSVDILQIDLNSAF